MNSIEKLEELVTDNLQHFKLSKGRKTLKCGYLSVYPLQDGKTVKIYAESEGCPKIEAWSNNQELYDRVVSRIRELDDLDVQELIEIAEEEIYQATKE